MLDAADGDDISVGSLKSGRASGSPANRPASSPPPSSGVPTLSSPLLQLPKLPPRTVVLLPANLPRRLPGSVPKQQPSELSGPVILVPPRPADASVVLPGTIAGPVIVLPAFHATLARRILTPTQPSGSSQSQLTPTAAPIASPSSQNLALSEERRAAVQRSCGSSLVLPPQPPGTLLILPPMESSSFPELPRRLRTPSLTQPQSFVASEHLQMIADDGHSQRKRTATQLLNVVSQLAHYETLCSLEGRLDAFLARKILDLERSLDEPCRRLRRLRIFVSHTFFPGTESKGEDNDGQLPSWELEVCGCVDGEDASSSLGGSLTDGERSSGKKREPAAKFSTFLKSVAVELDDGLYGPDNHCVEWHRQPLCTEFDGFRIRRPGDQDVQCKILLMLNYDPMRFKVHPKLSRVISASESTPARIAEALWLYIRTHNLQDEQDEATIRCDRYLARVLGADHVHVRDLWNRLSALLFLPDAVVINYTVRCNQPRTKTTTEYLFDADVDDPLRAARISFLSRYPDRTSAEEFERRTDDLLEMISECSLRRSFYKRYADNPVPFLHELLLSQKADAKRMKIDSESSRRWEDSCLKTQTFENAIRRYMRCVELRREILEPGSTSDSKETS